MHRYTIFLLLILSLVFGGLSVWAQGTPSDPTPSNQPIIVTPPSQMITGSQEWQSIELTELNESFPSSPLAAPAADLCSAAPPLTLTQSGDGGEVNVTNFEVEGSDPVLSCRWNGAGQGYRTAWYYFVAPSNGHVFLETLNSDAPYDTILAVHSGSCGAFTEIACNDDNNGFFSAVTVTVRKGETYYVEVADWNQAAPTTKMLSIRAWMLPVKSNWVLKSSLPIALSRHATAVAGSSIYVIGGQKSQLGTIDIVNSLRRYDTTTNQWFTLQSMPGTGYSNTSAAFVDGPNDNGRIYLPSGYVGGAYDMTHWTYDIQGGYWFSAKSLTDAIGGTAPFAWATAVADPSVNGYYLAGGLASTEPFTPTATVKNEMYLYLPGSDTWLPRTAMNSARYAHTGALVNGRVCVAGGISNNNILLVDGECYTQGVGWGNIAAMNIPRYAAASAVGLDGRWYVIGGINAQGEAVAETEVYDMASNTWTLLPVGDDLGNSVSLPARAWPRGGTVGSTFFAIGGNNMPDQQPLPFVESLFLPSTKVLLPVIFSNYGDDTRSDDNFATAHALAFYVPQFRNFDNNNDYFDVYYFDLASPAIVTVRLTQIPNNSNYDVFVYNSQKELRGTGNNVFLGMDENVLTPLLPAGRYYVMVKRVEPVGIPNTANYRIIVEK